jgi:hypothetical protein
MRIVRRRIASLPANSDGTKPNQTKKILVQTKPNQGVGSVSNGSKPNGLNQAERNLIQTEPNRENPGSNQTKPKGRFGLVRFGLITGSKRINDTCKPYGIFHEQQCSFR